MEICGELEENPFDKIHIRIHSPQQLLRVIPEQTVQALLQSDYDAYTPWGREFSGISSQGHARQWDVWRLR